MRLFDSELQTLLGDDVPHGDLTTRSLGIGERRTRMQIRCRRSDMTAACVLEASRMCEMAGLVVEFVVPEGSLLREGDTLLRATGSAAAVHQAWKAVQNLIDFAGGIATYTRKMVDAARAVNPNIVVATTRKTPPFAKKIAIKSVEAGGGVAHRLGLSESLLVFEEHRCFFDNDDALHEALLHVKRQNPEKPLVIEVHSLEEARVFARMGSDILQLEKFPLTELKSSITTLRGEFPHLRIIATGGITLDNVADYAASGADIIVTSAPYSAPSADVKVQIEAL